MSRVYLLCALTGPNLIDECDVSVACVLIVCEQGCVTCLTLRYIRVSPAASTCVQCTTSIQIVASGNFGLSIFHRINLGLMIIARNTCNGS
jgi:hypothetical protein